METQDFLQMKDNQILRGQICGGKEIKDCIACESNSNQCKTCFNQIKLSDDKLACCGKRCHGCTSADRNVCIGCDKKSDKPFYQDKICQSCEEIFHKCASCKQVTFFSKVICTKCKDNFTGEICEKTCLNGFKQYDLDYCQPNSCYFIVPCSGNGICQSNGHDLVCKCDVGVSGPNCEIKPECLVNECELCDKDDKQICRICNKDFKLYENKCIEKSCKESIENCKTGCQGKTGSFTCQQCKSEFTGSYCDISCGEGMKQYKTKFCQSDSCDQAIPCNENGDCVVNEVGNNICKCTESFSGPNCRDTCLSPCKTCQNNNTSFCITCYEGDIIQNNTCTNCIKLFPNCKKCSSTTPLVCEQCLPSFTTADCSQKCEIGTIPYKQIACQPESCITDNPCNGKSQCVPSGNGLKCDCNKNFGGPNCKIFIGTGIQCDGNYTIPKCMACSGGTPNLCAFCANGYVLSTDHTECCDQSCTNCVTGQPQICTACTRSENPYLVDGKCVSCDNIKNCSKCTQSAPNSPLQCNLCISTFTGPLCSKDCGKGQIQFGTIGCQPKSCDEASECGGNGKCVIQESNKVCNCDNLVSGVNCEIFCKVVGCEACVTDTTDKCQKCISGYHMVNNQCMQDIPMVCEIDNCDQCIPDISSQCRVCKKGYRINGNNCVKDPPIECKIEGCIECHQNGESCKRCETYLALSDDNTKCMNCIVINCEKCYQQNPYQCEICQQNLREQTNCTDCKEGYLMNNRNCQKCGQNCKKCDQEECLECVENFLLEFGICTQFQTSAISIGGIIGIVITIFILIGGVVGIVIFIKMRKNSNKLRNEDKNLLNNNYSGRMVTVG